MRPLESAVATTRRNIRTLLAVGASLALLASAGGGLLFYFGQPRPDLTLTLSECGGYILGIGLLNVLIYAGLLWQVGRLSKRPRPLPPAADASKGLERTPASPHTSPHLP